MLLDCVERDRSVSGCVDLEVDCPLVRTYKEVEYLKDLSTLVSVLMGNRYPKSVRGLSSYVGRLVTCTSPNTSVTLCVTATLSFVCIVMRRIYWLAGTTSKVFAIRPSHRASHYIVTPGWWRELQGCRLLCVKMLLVFAYYSCYI